MNIFKHEMRMHFSSIVIWSISFSAAMLLFMSLYPAIAKNVANFTNLLDNFPPEFLAAFSIELESFGSPLGFYAFTFVYSSLIAAIQAMKYGLSILSIEEREKTADFLLSKPISRQRILIGKVSAVIVSLIITNVVFFTTAYVTVSRHAGSGLDLRLFTLITLSVFLVQLVFMSIGLMISMIPRKIKAVTPITMGVVFGFFTIQLFASAFEDKSLEFLTPFKYFDAESILETGHYDPLYSLIAVIIILTSAIFTYVRYVRKDMAQI
jgi:ABC-2 type transport system permease protein